MPDDWRSPLQRGLISANNLSARPVPVRLARLLSSLATAKPSPLTHPSMTRPNALNALVWRAYPPHKAAPQPIIVRANH